MIVLKFDLERHGERVVVEIEIDTSGSKFDRLVRHLAHKALESKTGVSKIAHGVIRAKIIR